MERTKRWRNKQTHRHLSQKIGILKFKTNIENRELYLSEIGRLNKVGVSDLELFEKPRYKRSQTKRDTQQHLMELAAYGEI